MIKYFLEESKHVREVTIYYFEPHHGQSECDSIHSTIEAKIKQAGEIMIPAQISMLIRMAKRREPMYKVFELETNDVKNWKLLSQNYQMLKPRITDNGQVVNWTQFKAVRLLKEKPSCIFVKYLHSSSEFDSITLQTKRGNPKFVVENLYKNRPSLSKEKYNDLMSLCRGPTSVVRNPEYKSYFQNLPH